MTIGVVNPNTTCTLQLSGSLKVTPPPSASDNSLNPQILAQVLEQLPVNVKSYDEYVLSSDSPQVINFAGLAQAQALMVKVMPGGGPVTCQVSSPAGATQDIPADPFAFIIAAGAAFTALSVTRTPGILTTIRVLLATL